MPIVGFWNTPVTVGAINTTWSHTVTQRFSGPREIWAHTALSRVFVADDPADAHMHVSQFKDGSGTHNVKWVGFYSPDCTEVTYRMRARDAYCVGQGKTEFFG